MLNLRKSLGLYICLARFGGSSAAGLWVGRSKAKVSAFLYEWRLRNASYPYRVEGHPQTRNKGSTAVVLLTFLQPSTELVGDEGLDLPLAGPKLRLSKQVSKSRSPCKLSDGSFHPIAAIGIRFARKYQRKKTTYWRSSFFGEPKGGQFRNLLS